MGSNNAIPTNAVHNGKFFLKDFGRDEKGASNKATDLKRQNVSHAELKCSIFFSSFISNYLQYVKDDKRTQESRKKRKTGEVPDEDRSRRELEARR